MATIKKSIITSAIVAGALTASSFALTTDTVNADELPKDQETQNNESSKNEPVKNEIQESKSMKVTAPDTLKDDVKLPEDVTYKDGSFTMNSTDYTNNRDKIDAKFNELTKEITQKVVPTVSIDNKRVNRKTVTQTITVTNPDGTSKDINDAYDHAVSTC